ncbi:MAG: hypothetical protein PUA49_03530 [Butyrivibrio sp.]|nr:hypothetical protein [Butyrivibrio sp.]
MRKRLFIAALVGVVVFSISGCGKNKDNSNNGDTKAPDESTAVVDNPTETVTEEEPTEVPTEEETRQYILNEEQRGYWTENLDCAGNESSHTFYQEDYAEEGAKHAVIGNYVNEYFDVQINFPTSAGRKDDDYIKSDNAIDNRLVAMIYFNKLATMNIYVLNDFESAEDYLTNATRFMIIKQYHVLEDIKTTTIGSNTYYYRESHERNPGQYWADFALMKDDKIIAYQISAYSKAQVEEIIKYIVK